MRGVPPVLDGERPGDVVRVKRAKDAPTTDQVILTSNRVFAGHDLSSRNTEDLIRFALWHKTSMVIQDHE